MDNEEFQAKLLQELGGIRKSLETLNENLEGIQEAVRDVDLTCNHGWHDGNGGDPSPVRAIMEIGYQLMHMNGIKIPPSNM